MPTIDDIADFVRQETGHENPIGADMTLQDDLGVFGDDMSDLLDAYANTFHVDMSKHLWYFHTGEEGGGCLGWLFFAPPHRRVAEIPITIRLLHEFANSGEWSVRYPVHVLPTRRYDVLIDQALILGVLALVAFGAIKC